MSDGNWHTAVVERKKRLGSITVDGEKPVRVTADPGATILNTNGKLWIGMIFLFFLRIIYVQFTISIIDLIQAAAQYSLPACLPRTTKLLLVAWNTPKWIATIWIGIGTGITLSFTIAKTLEICVTCK